ncbi:unnamed protein product [Bemisia tabaci]|uniref:Elongation of very long chain fatty acids protein n=1 Tax=Bemisia tabaci TaxID=7038 RepID=A0A9P0F0K7_BEMTA|nr:PREDICTED: elongation of very long chain fatty acids protein 4-like [Bemisia tabaci]CAH0384642.1 unnamed protein product [Bemisia tabaci]
MTQVQRGSWIQEKIDLIKSEIVRDDVVDGWFLMGSVWPIAAIISVYLIFVLKVGPKFMEKRKPLEMKGIMLAYNLFQVFQNGWLVWLLFSYPGSMTYTAKHICTPLGRNNNPFFIPICAGSWHFFMSKVYDLLDTVFFVLRKKQSHVTFLHVYHHANMVLASWAYLKYMKGEQAVFIGVLNAFVHVVMYSYYFLSALGPSVQKYLWWKKYITKLQITQFVMIITFVSVLLWFNCKILLSYALYASVNAFIFLILFLNFYAKTYNKKREVRTTEDKNK